MGKVIDFFTWIKTFFEGNPYEGGGGGTTGGGAGRWDGDTGYSVWVDNNNLNMPTGDYSMVPTTKLPVFATENVRPENYPSGVYQADVSEERSEYDFTNTCPDIYTLRTHCTFIRPQTGALIPCRFYVKVDVPGMYYVNISPRMTAENTKRLEWVDGMLNERFANLIMYNSSTGNNPDVVPVGTEDDTVSFGGIQYGVARTFQSGGVDLAEIINIKDTPTTSKSSIFLMSDYVYYINFNLNFGGFGSISVIDKTFDFKASVSTVPGGYTGTPSIQIIDPVILATPGSFLVDGSNPEKILQNFWIVNQALTEFTHPLTNVISPIAGWGWDYPTRRLNVLLKSGSLANKVVTIDYLKDYLLVTTPDETIKLLYWLPDDKKENGGTIVVPVPVPVPTPLPTPTPSETPLPEPNNDIIPVMPNPPQKPYSAYNRLWAISNDDLNALGSYLWNSTFLNDIKLLFSNPMEAIVSCKMFPFSVTGHDPSGVGGMTSIKLGNVDTPVTGNPILSSYNNKFNLGSYTVTEYYGDFLDYSPYTSVEIYLPYIGFRRLDPSQIMQKTISVSYIVDLSTGVCTASVYNGIQMILSADGNMGADVLISGSNASQFLANITASVAASVVGFKGLSMAAGAIAQAGLFVSSAQNIASNKLHVEKTGTIDSLNNFYLPNKCFIVYNRPYRYTPTNFSKFFGRPSSATSLLKDLTGYTECGNVILNGIPDATEDEKKEIKTLLESGVIL